MTHWASDNLIVWCFYGIQLRLVILYQLCAKLQVAANASDKHP